MDYICIRGGSEGLPDRKANKTMSRANPSSRAAATVTADQCRRYSLERRFHCPPVGRRGLEYENDSGREDSL